LGTLLREQFDFGRRELLEKAYRKVFYKNESEIDAIFADDKLNWVAALRNIIVHDAGKATQLFEKLVALHPYLKNFPAPNFVPLDGVLVLEMVNIVIAKGKALLDFVDDWIKNNAR